LLRLTSVLASLTMASCSMARGENFSTSRRRSVGRSLAGEGAGAAGWAWAVEASSLGEVIFAAAESGSADEPFGGLEGVGGGRSFRR